VYDLSGKGFVTEQDLTSVLRQLVGDNLPEGTLETIVKHTIEEADMDGDGKLSYQDFHSALHDLPHLREGMSILFA
jgi:serine/threonine-protein phosphatase 2B regulatory subunit